MKTAEIWTIGPAEAQDLLAGNRKNRRINKRTVALYVSEMRAGRWKENGQSFSIVKTEDGRIILLNGQHRLTAIVETGMTFRFVVVTEDDISVFSTLDTGSGRTAVQILQMAGFKNTTALQAIARYNKAYHEMPEKIWHEIVMSKQEILDWAETQDLRVMDVVSTTYHEARNHFPVTNTWYAALAYLVQVESNHRDRWYEFASKYSWGNEMRTEDPRMALRRYTTNRAGLDRPRGHARIKQTGWDRQAHLAVGLRAWQKFIDGETVMHLRFNTNMLPMPGVR